MTAEGGERGLRRPLPADLTGPAGLCKKCRHLELSRSERSVFVRCALSRTDPSYPRYPALPVLSCDGFDRQPEEGQVLG